MRDKINQVKFKIVWQNRHDPSDKREGKSYADEREQQEETVNCLNRMRPHIHYWLERVEENGDL